MTPIWANPGTPENYMLGEYVSVKLFGAPGRFRDFTAMGVIEGERLEAAMIYHNWDPQHGVLEMSGASETPRWLNRQVLRAMHSFPFDVAGAQLLIMRVAENDNRLERILCSAGYRKYVIERLRGRDKNEAIYTLTDDEWNNGAFWKKVRRETRNGQISS